MAPPLANYARGVGYAIAVGVMGLSYLGISWSMYRTAFGPHRFEGYTDGYRLRMVGLTVFGLLHLVASAVLFVVRPFD